MSGVFAMCGRTYHVFDALRHCKNKFFLNKQRVELLSTIVRDRFQGYESGADLRVHSVHKLGLSSLDSLAECVQRPLYRRNQLTAGIVHIGIGNFHRAHQAWYVHQLMQEGRCLDWAIVGAGVRSFDSQQREKLKEQDYLTTLLELQPNEISAQVIGSMIDFIPITEGHTALIDRITQPDIRIVSLTITEGGYYTDHSTGGLDLKHPDIVHDISQSGSPCTVFGALVLALKQRRLLGMRGFTCMSCDNIQGNGTLLKQAVLSLAKQVDGDLAFWIEDVCSFPNSMVDCIVPATGVRELNLVHSFGIDDAAPVTHENFRQWVIEDDFCAGRPEWERVGVIFTPRVHAFEALKIRILNGGHQLLANVGELLGLEFVSQCVLHPVIGAYVRKVLLEEVAPYLESTPGMSPQEYVDLVLARWSHPKILDTTRRVAFDGSSRHPGFVVPSIAEAIEAGVSPRGLAIAEAIWARMCAGSRESGEEIEGNDPKWDILKKKALEARGRPLVWLEQRDIYGTLAEEKLFADAFCAALSEIWEQGVLKVVRTYLST